MELREKKVSFSQFQAKVYRRAGVCNYKVLDDIFDDLADSIKAELASKKNKKLTGYDGQPIKVSELLRPLEPWEVNKKCLRSIKYHHKKSRR